MPIALMLLPEFDHEMANTRRLLEVVPAPDREWRPHARSWTLGELASHIATLPLWARITMERSELDPGSPANAGLQRSPCPGSR